MLGICTFLMILNYRLILSRRYQPTIQPSKASSKSVVIHVNSVLKPYQNTWNHPWHLLHLTRKCKVPCVVLSVDQKYNRYFYQRGFDHVWLDDEAEIRSLVSSANIQLYVDKAKFGKNVAVIASRDSALQNLPGSLIINHHSTPSTDLVFNFITNAYSDISDFWMRVSQGNAFAKDFAETIPRAITFLPNCTQLSQSTLELVTRLAESGLLHVWSGCKSTSIPHAVNTPDDKKLKLVAKYRWIAVFCDTDWVSEEYYRALAYHSLLIVVYPGNLAPYLPCNDCVLREFEGLERQTREEWEERMSWKRSKVAIGAFESLFYSGIESTVCRLCEKVAEDFS